MQTEGVQKGRQALHKYKNGDSENRPNWKDNKNIRNT